MPPKVRELIAQLERNGFVNRGGKGSYSNFYHPLCSGIVTVSGKERADALSDQMKQIKEALEEVRRNEEGS